MSVNGHVIRASGAQVRAGYADSFVAMARIGVIAPDLAHRLAPSAGLRNVLTHRYGDIDLGKVAAAAPQTLSDYSDYVRQASAWLVMQPD